MLGQLGAEVVDLRKHIGHVHHMAHGETWIHLAHLRAIDHAIRGFSGVDLAAAAENIKTAGAPRRLRHQLAGQNFLLAPHHAIFQRGVKHMVGMQARVHHFNIVHHANKHVGLQALEKIKVARGEQAVAPAECCVRVHDHVWMLIRRRNLADDVLECRAAQAG